MPRMAWGKLLLLLLLALGTTWGSPWCCSAASTGAQQIKTTSIKKRTFTLPSNCPTRCGNISIQYPFGIGKGCYRPGFNLTCLEQYSRDVPARLFMGDGTLEVTGIDMSSRYVSFKLPVIRMGVNQSSITVSLIDLQNYHNFNVWVPYNFLFVSGCNVNASIVDLTHNNAIIYNCSTICLDVSSDLSPLVIRHKRCKIYIVDGLPNGVSLGVPLTRLNQTRLPLASATEVSAYMTSSIGSFESQLSWYVGDHSSCNEAMNDTGTFACISSNSYCVDASTSYSDNTTVGYYCSCSGGTEGNPYLTDGCKDVTTANIYPAKNCTRTCGSLDVPFPFGLDDEPDCYRDSSFGLFCNRTHPVLQYQNTNVSKVDVDSGELILMEVRNADQDLDLTEGHYVYSWLIPYQSCEDAKMNKSAFACVSEHITCINDSEGDQLGYRCKCEKGYTGNPYILNGCQDINECHDPGKYICKGICKNTEGSYNCTCEPGTYGNPTIRGGCIPHTKKRPLMFALIITAGNVSLLLLCVMLVILRKKWKKRMHKQIKEKNFHQNHGLLLQQLISTSEHDAERTKLFSLEEIEKATNNFDETRMLGRGGHGIVYKGILSDQRVVAIKKSTNLKKSEIDQFINEVAILSQINHRHIVKLFGCCLETEIPLLIYEFISNDTLSHHLHVPNGQSKLSWDDRLRIATEVACSLAYLHSDVSMSIFHRDIKSLNILLDDNLIAKVSDFGASRFIPLDQNYVVTAVQGTFGYLDPEYYQTSQLTEKSDVYSFGVILLELLTGKAPIYSNEHGDIVNLSQRFLQAMRENHALDLVEDRVLKEGNKEELLEIMQMIKMCLRLKGAERPTMKEVEHKLQGLRRFRMAKKRLPSFAEDNETTETYYSDAFDPSAESVDQRNQGTSTSYSSEKDLMYQQSYSPR